MSGYTHITKSNHEEVVEQLDLLNVLARYEPTLIGTPPLNIDIDSSDIDIACSTERLEDFASAVEKACSIHRGFLVEAFQTRGLPAVRCVFDVDDWRIELFCQTLPIEEQWGVRHFRIEQQLLHIEPALRPAVVQLKRAGLKTEAAFAQLLGLDGDPFEAVLALEALNREELVEFVTRAKVQGSIR